jgi:lipopolysaccharide transport system ATP-binding protein
LWLKEGRVERYGSSAEVTQAYLAYHEERNAAAKQPGTASGTGMESSFAIEALSLDPDGRLPSGGALTVQGRVFSRDGLVPVILIGIVRADGTPVYGIGSDTDRVTPARIDERRFSFAVTFPELPLLPGKYLVRVHALDACRDRLFENVERSFVVEGDTRELGMIRIAHRWRNVADAAASAAAPLDAP